MNDLNDIFVFAAVVKYKGFSAAAHALKLPKSSVSRRVGRLEARLGVRLLERATRKLRPTEAGATFYERCRSILIDVDEAERDLVRRRSEPMGGVRVSCPVGIAQQFLSRLVPDFMAQYPSVRLDVVATNGREELDRAVAVLHERLPGYVFNELRPLDQLHESGRLAWSYGRPGQEPIKGLDVILVRVGRISLMLTFLDEVPAKL